MSAKCVNSATQVSSIMRGSCARKSVPSFLAAAQAEVNKLPKVSGGGREADKVYVAQDVDRALNAAEETAKSMKDEYISVEHLFLGCWTPPTAP